jgi:uncharacterized protein
MRRARRLLLIPMLTTFLVLSLSGGFLHAAARPVTFRADDGRTVTALLNEASQRPAPAVVLVPMLGRPKDDWQAAAQRFADANITALVIDLPALTLPEDPKAIVGWSKEIRTALTFLEGRPEVRSGALGVAGASLGGSLAALAAAADPRVKALALVSPSLDYRGVRIESAMRQYGGRPALLVSSRQDFYAARSARELAKEPPGIRDLLWADQAAHGTTLLSRAPELIQGFVEWFQRTLG